MLRALGLASLVFATFATPAGAAAILQDQQNSTANILIFSPVGQSFIAEDAHVSIGFALSDMNSFANPLDDGITIRLLAGEGTGGAVLGSGDVTGLTLNFNGWVDVDFSFLALTPGSIYTAVLVDDTNRWGIQFRTDGNPYAGGTFYVQGSPFFTTTADARFRVLPQQAPQVPEPLTLLLTAVGMAGVAARRRR